MAESRCWGIREYCMDALELPNTTALGPDITRLTAVEWELEQEYENLRKAV
ncbi:Hypothetical predicted protein [Pelobates cultripes]|uniref:Uncharacterized protein n=1 Tax=Pelobates cultripes TaxID=61616 RepID=A0AAD1T087_PELCU|nr:Hypothetical predicted protein [Pelobates cultripes]